MQVQDVMSQDFVVCHPHDTLSTAAGLMLNHSLQRLPVVGFEGKLIGIVSDRDICMAAYGQGKLLKNINVENIMEERIHSVDATDSLDRVERVMQETQICHVPVADNHHRIVGMLSLSDLIRNGHRKSYSKPHKSRYPRAKFAVRDHYR